jgi:ribonuclease P protein component
MGEHGSSRSIPSPVGARFPREARVRKRVDFKRIQGRGTRVHTAHFLLVLEAAPSDVARLGITVTKRIGSAVRRNRVKRLVREVFRRHHDVFPARCDLVVIAKDGAPELGYADVEGELTRAKGAMSKAAERVLRANEATR